MHLCVQVSVKSRKGNGSPCAAVLGDCEPFHLSTGNEFRSSAKGALTLNY